ncbi:MAG: DUF2163 domain-containing protein [Neomegalonema sp.]|nr:DUF2163 domain-containing protein [Neomegalonema sp.]
MRPIPAALQAALDSGASTLCRCWLLTRPDGLRLGFTDHDRPLSFLGQTFEPASGFTASALDQAEGLSVDNAALSGALSSDKITAAEIDAGQYDGAQVEAYLVDWQEPGTHLLLSRGHLGEIRRQGSAFEAELRGLSSALNAPQGRALTATCDAALGDTRCTVDLPSLVSESEIVEILSERLVTLASDAEEGTLTHGTLTPTTGALAGRALAIKAHRRRSALAEIELWTAPPAQLTQGQGVTLSPGCDKRLTTCAERFSNQLNFRGFAHMPGQDWLTAVPRADQINDGGSRSA